MSVSSAATDIAVAIGVSTIDTTSTTYSATKLQIQSQVLAQQRQGAVGHWA